MKRRDFLNLSTAEQAVLIAEIFPDFQMRAYEDTCIGITYEVSDDRIYDYLEFPEHYGTFDILQSTLPEFTESRAVEIQGGALLNQKEKISLKQHIADNDATGWTGIHGWNLKCDDGEVFVVFWGYLIAGGIHLHFHCAFNSQRQAEDWAETLEIFSYM